jgi:hypothetical protein
MKLNAALLHLALFFACCEATEFYDSDEYESIVTDDGTSLPISLNPPLPYFGEKYTNCTIWANGILELHNDTRGMGRIDELPVENYTLVAPFFADFNVEMGGTIKYSPLPVSQSTSLDKAQEQIINFTQHDEFQPKYLILATWEEVAGYFNEPNDLVCNDECDPHTNSFHSRLGIIFRPMFRAQYRL